jgi:metallo-beta-lactamase family protein
MKISFLGAAQTVTGSQHLIQVNGYKLLLECGLYQGKRKDFYERNANFPFEPAQIDAVILSHAHIDHSGNLPNLVKRGFSGRIYATPATAHLADLMLRDSGHVQEAQAENINYHKAKRGEPLVEALYTEEDAARVKDHLHNQDYNQVFEPVPGVTARLVDAGHILGSAAVVLEVEEKGKKSRLWFSGDIGRLRLPILNDPTLPDENVDYLIMECTYGDKPHREPEEAYQEMRKVIQRTIRRGGKVIIPAFAVGRTQELVYNLNRMYEAGDLPGIPIYVDSPLAVNASQIFKQHPECFDEAMMKQIQRGHPALEFKNLKYIQSLDDSKALNERKDPMVIISASGMAEFGRVVYHIKYNIENQLNTIMIVSWQAPNTLGRLLADRIERVKIFGEQFKRKAEVATIGGLSAHAGQDFLVQYAQAARGRLKKIFLVHGEKGAAGALQEKFAGRGLEPAFYPEMQEAVELE